MISSLGAERWSELRAMVKEEAPRAIALRRAIHRHPEIALHETRTSALLRQELTQAGLQPWTPLLGTDVIVELPGRDRDTTICLRADMDALPLTENPANPFSSEVAGMAHACGHDGHTAMLLGAALVLRRLQQHLPVNVRLIFQPGEEVQAAGRDLVAAGCCKGASAAFALHGFPGLPVGVLATKPGVMMATGGAYDVELIGKGCHGASPQNGNNPLLCAGLLLTELDVLHRRVQQQDGSVVSVCAMQGGQSSNVIPERCHVRGTFRCLTACRGDELADLIRSTTEEVAAGRGIQATIRFDRRYALPTINSQDGYERVRDVVIACLGRQNWSELQEPSMGMEDFAFYLDACGGCFTRIGTGENSAPLHSPDYHFPDEALPNGMLFLCALALSGALRSAPPRAPGHA